MKIPSLFSLQKYAEKLLINILMARLTLHQKDDILYCNLKDAFPNSLLSNYYLLWVFPDVFCQLNFGVLKHLISAGMQKCFFFLHSSKHF